MEAWVDGEVKMVNLPSLREETNLPSTTTPRAIDTP